ncbi:type 11 methyltransferase [Thalassobaculum fulvum]|uniref:Type 11 methyltransferase n=2 Tax=Thalassobaculum fulvum TaxID=1633335 RepID=A0A919CPZ4_9PROT|nr:type 11 methyltransferase [Thalassobaculum fulvum]
MVTTGSVNEEHQRMIAGPTASRLRETWGYLRWFYWPFGSMSARDIYELVSTNAFSNDGLYLNLGYWKDAATIDEACQGMARLLAETAGFGPDDTVLDVGFGFGDQDMFWAATYGVRIVGLNITPSQVETARRRVMERGLADRIELLEASATDMPLEPASVDKVVGLECAFHFDTRERFFHEAFRVLRPGGRMALADVVPNAPLPGGLARRVQRMNWNTFSKKYSVPAANADSHDAYRAKLESAGFRDVRIESIRHHVYPGLHAYMKRDPRMLARFHPLARFPYKMTLFFSPEHVYSAYDYILVSAEKPA